MASGSGCHPVAMVTSRDPWVGDDTETEPEWLGGRGQCGQPCKGHLESLAEWAPGIQMGDSAICIMVTAEDRDWR